MKLPEDKTETEFPET
jgi:hypothetical protein